MEIDCIYVCEYVHIPKSLLLVIFLCSFQIVFIIVYVWGFAYSLSVYCLYVVPVEAKGKWLLDPLELEL